MRMPRLVFCCIIEKMADQNSRHESTRKIGDWGEAQASAYLVFPGFEILAQNIYTEFGEIDLVAQKADWLHFVEVKTKRTKSFGYPEEAVTERKLRHMTESAQSYIQAHPEFDTDYQLDVLAIQVDAQGNQEILYF